MIWNETLAGLHAKITQVIYIFFMHYTAAAELHCACVNFTKELRAAHMKHECMSLFVITESENYRSAITNNYINHVSKQV